MITTVEITGVAETLKLLNGLPKEVVSKRGGPILMALRTGARVILAQAKQNLARSIKNARGESTGLLMSTLGTKRGSLKDLDGIKGEVVFVQPRVKKYSEPGVAFESLPEEVRIKRRKRAWGTSPSRKRGSRVGNVANTFAVGSILEYGAQPRQPARPWMRPAFNAKAAESIKVTADSLKKRVDKLVKKYSF